MENTIELLKEAEVPLFWPIFSRVLTTQFPGYAPEVIHYFLNTIYTPPVYQYWINTTAKFVLVARDQQTGIIGFALIDRPYGGVSLCRWLGVLPGYQRQGIGSKLIQEWEKQAGQQGAHKMEVAAQPEAKDFYAKCELKLEGKRQLSYFGIDQYIYGKVIGQPDPKLMVKS